MTVGAANMIFSNISMDINVGWIWISKSSTAWNFTPVDAAIPGIGFMSVDISTRLEVEFSRHNTFQVQHLGVDLSANG